MAGNLFISQALLVLLTFHGVFSTTTTRQLKWPHMCQASDESSEEGCLIAPQPQQDVNPVQDSNFGNLIFSDFKVKYSLFNGDSKEYTFTYENFDGSIAKTKFNANAPLKVLAHGFLNNGHSLFPTNVRDAYIKRMQDHPNQQKYNVLVYDWGQGACAELMGWGSIFRPYNNAASNVEEAGKKLGDMLVKLHEMKITNVTTDVHIIGHSLGSHVAGHAGRQVFTKLKTLLWRISALDPAGPFFWEDKMFLTHQDPFSRLHRNRVRFLDVYHTSRYFGSEQKIGDVDFFINGGESQDSCSLEFITPIFKFKIPVPVSNSVLQVCSHNYATDIFAKSINDKTMIGCTGCYSYEEYKNDECTCEDLVVMGEFVDEERLNGYPVAYGSAYLTTPKDTAVGSNYFQYLWNNRYSGWKLFNDNLKSLCFFNYLSSD